MAENTKEEKELNFKLYVRFAIVMMIIVISAYILNFNNQSISKDSGDWGTFGDFIGGTLNPTLAFLSFLALLQTIRIQSKELKKSSEALELSKEELSKSSKALEEQSASLKIQNFETTYFNMLSLHNEITNTINIEQGRYGIAYTKFKEEEEISLLARTNLKGRESIGFLRELCTNYFCEFNTYKSEENYYDYKYNHKSNLTIEQKNQVSRTNKLYIDFYKIYSEYIGHYFRNIYQIIEFIDLSLIKNKEFYINTLKAQLSNDEIEILFYHTVSNIDSKKLLLLLIKYEFFENFIFTEKISKHDIQYCIEKTKEMDSSYPDNKLFGDNEEWKEYISTLNTSSQEQQ